VVDEDGEEKFAWGFQEEGMPLEELALEEP
jgi:hypothetical protein